MTMGDRRALAKAAAIAAIAAEASRERQIAYEIEQERIVADRKRRQAAEQEQRERDARQRATAAAVRPPLPPHAVGSTSYGARMKTLPALRDSPRITPAGGSRTKGGGHTTYIRRRPPSLK